MTQSDHRLSRNVLGEPLVPCSFKPLTGFFRDGFFRDGCCTTGADDAGAHVVCVVMSAAFLAFSKRRGNDLSTPRPELHFPGLKAGDQWCLCAMRWQEALEAGVAPPVVLESTNQTVLQIIGLDQLRKHACAVQGED